MTTIFLAIGSNVGDSQANIRQAIKLLGKSVSHIQQAQLYRSKALPVPGHPDLPDFVNTAIKAETNLSPQELLQFTQQVEKEVGKVYRFHWGPREIDIDIIFYGDQVINTAQLTVPHPHAHERDFVLKPLSDLDGSFVHPKTGQSVQQMLELLPPSNLAVIA